MVIEQNLYKMQLEVKIILYNIYTKFKNVIKQLIFKKMHRQITKRLTFIKQIEI